MFAQPTDKMVTDAYQQAKEQYALYGVDTDAAIAALEKIAISLHCWQADDVGGFEHFDDVSGGGIMATGGYPGKATTPDEMRGDLEKVLSLLPGKHRLNLHSIYAETGGKKVERNELAPEHFSNWIDWAKAQGIGMDFNGSFFAHPKANDGFTLSHGDDGIRNFWVEHAIACRKIGAEMGKALGSPCVTNVWVPDGFKDIPVDRKAPRERLKKSLDEIFAENIDKSVHLDAVECKLFGIGMESCTIGSHEFYMGYAVANDKLLCLDAGHFHPTEVISDKITSVLTFVDEILLHVSRPVRWDSDHVVILNDELNAIASEIVRGGYLDRTHIGLDFFDASINRISAYVVGVRSMQKALLAALLEPTDTLRQIENSGDYATRMAMLEELKTMAMGAVWDYCCLKNSVPVSTGWINEVKKYEADVLSKRG